MLSHTPGRPPLLLVLLLLQAFRVETGAHPELRTPVYQRLQRMDQQFQQFQKSTLSHLDALSQNQHVSLGLEAQVQTLTDQYHRISEDLDHLKNTTTQEIDVLRDSSRKLEKKSKRIEGRLASLERSLRLFGRHARRQSPELGLALSNLTLELQGQEGRLSSFEEQREELLSGLRGLQESLKDQELRISRLEGRVGKALQRNRGVLGQGERGDPRTSSRNPPDPEATRTGQASTGERPRTSTRTLGRNVPMQPQSPAGIYPEREFNPKPLAKIHTQAQPRPRPGAHPRTRFVPELPVPSHPQRLHPLQKIKKSSAHPETYQNQNRPDPESRPQPHVQVWPNLQPQTHPNLLPAQPRQTNDRRMRTRPPSAYPTRPPAQPQDGLTRLGDRERHWPWVNQAEDKDRGRGAEKQTQINGDRTTEYEESERRRGEEDGGMTRRREEEEHRRRTTDQIKQGGSEREEERDGESKKDLLRIQNILQLPVRQKIPLHQIPRKEAKLCNVDSMLIFPSASPKNYVTFSRSFPNLPELSVCLWLRAEADYMGTLLSYATDDNDNQLVLYGRKSSPYSSSSSSSASPTLDFVVGDPVYRQLPADPLLDGDWHHLCVLWSSIQGRFWHFSDRRLTSTGSKFRKGYEVAGGGSVVLGQEQDTVGGGFDAAEAFVGRMAGFVVWDRVLSSQEVEGVAEGRGVPRGVVLTLEDIEGVHGEVRQVACECLEHCI